MLKTNAFIVLMILASMKLPQCNDTNMVLYNGTFLQLCMNKFQ